MKMFNVEINISLIETWVFITADFSLSGATTSKWKVEVVGDAAQEP